MTPLFKQFDKKTRKFASSDFLRYGLLLASHVVALPRQIESLRERDGCCALITGWFFIHNMG